MCFESWRNTSRCCTGMVDIMVISILPMIRSIWMNYFRNARSWNSFLLRIVMQMYGSEPSDEE